MMGVSGGTPRSHVCPTPVIVIEIVVIAAASASIAAVKVTGRVDGLHRDLGRGLGCCVEGLCPWVVLGSELNGRLHGDLGLLGKAVAAVGRRGAAVTWWRSVVRRRGSVIGLGRAVSTPIRTIHIHMWLDLDHVIGTWAEDRIKKETVCDVQNLVQI